MGAVAGRDEKSGAAAGTKGSAKASCRTTSPPLRYPAQEVKEDPVGSSEQDSDSSSEKGLRYSAKQGPEGVEEQDVANSEGLLGKGAGDGLMVVSKSHFILCTLFHQCQNYKVLGLMEG